MKHLFVVVAGEYLFILVIAGLIFAWIRARRETKLRFLLSAAVAGALAYGLSLLAAHMYFDPRPFVVRGVAPLIAHAADNGFPSDHALLTMTLSATTVFFNRKTAALMALVTVLVGVARVMALVHTPQDIAGAWVLGIVASVLGYYVVRALWPQIEKILPASLS